ncbi:hypothetical protein [Nocardia sp. IFM 10818]
MPETPTLLQTLRVYCLDPRLGVKPPERLDAQWVDAAPVRRHIRAHAIAGTERTRLAERARIPTAWARVLCSGQPEFGRGPIPALPRWIAARILTVPLPSRADSAAHRPRPTAVGLTRRLQALAAAGWPCELIAAEVGASVTTVAALTAATDTRGSLDGHQAALVCVLFDDLQGTPGPCRETASHASNYRPPMAWDADSLDAPSEMTTEVAAADPLLPGVEMPVLQVLLGLTAPPAEGHIRIAKEHQLAYAIELVRRGCRTTDISKAMHVSGRRARQLYDDAYDHLHPTPDQVA